MTWSDEGSPTNTLRATVNSPRGKVVAIVGGLSALGGAVAGGAAALIAAAVLTPSEPVSAAQVALMAVGYGVVAGVAGAVLGTIVAFGALRRVPLGRLIGFTNAGLAAGLTAGWLGGPWAWHHMELLGGVGFSAGALLALAVTRRSAMPSASRSFDSVPASGIVAPEPQGLVPTLAAPAEPVARAAPIVDRVPRSDPSRQ